MDIDCHYFSFYSISSAHPSINSIHLFYIFPFIYQLIIFFLTTNDSQLKLGSSIIINTYILHFVADHIYLLTFHFISFLWNIILSTVRIYTIYIFISAKCLVLFLIHRSRIPCHFALCDFSLIILVIHFLQCQNFIRCSMNWNGVECTYFIITYLKETGKMVNVS